MKRALTSLILATVLTGCLEIHKYPKAQFDSMTACYLSPKGEAILVVGNRHANWDLNAVYADEDAVKKPTASNTVNWQQLKKGAPEAKTLQKFTAVPIVADKKVTTSHRDHVGTPTFGDGTFPPLLPGAQYTLYRAMYSPGAPDDDTPCIGYFLLADHELPNGLNYTAIYIKPKIESDYEIRGKSPIKM